MKSQIPSMQDLLSAGVHFGHQVRRRHPKMDAFIYGARDGVHIIDLAKSEEKLKDAADFVFNLGKKDGVLLVVGTKKQAKEIVRELAMEVNTPYITERWVGGLLTNFDEIRKNIKKLIDLKKEKEAGTLSRYTKKEQLLIDRQLQKFERNFGGVAGMDKIPDAIFIVDAVVEKTAVKEARSKGVTLVGFADTNADPNLLDYPIPANDDGIKSIKIICEAILKAYGEGKKESIEKSQELEESKATKVEKDEKESPSAKVIDSEAVSPQATSVAQTRGASGDKKLDEVVAEEAAVIEEEVEKKALEESERKV